MYSNEEDIELYPKKWTTKSCEYGINKEKVRKNGKIYKKRKRIIRKES